MSTVLSIQYDKDFQSNVLTHCYTSEVVFKNIILINILFNFTCFQLYKIYCVWIQFSETFLFFLIFIVIQSQLYAFSPHPSTPPQLNPPPSPTSTLPLDFVHVSFIVVPVIPSPHCLLPTAPCSLLQCS